MNVYQHMIKAEIVIIKYRLTSMAVILSGADLHLSGKNKEHWSATVRLHY